MMHVLHSRCNGGVYPSWRHDFAVPVRLRAAGQIAGGLGFECRLFCMTNLASGGLLSCRAEDFSLPAASEATEEPRRGRFVLPTFSLGDGQANRLPLNRPIFRHFWPCAIFSTSLATASSR